MQRTVNHRFQKRNMKDGVNLECCGELQSDGTWVDDAVNSAGTDVPGSHLM